MQLFFSPEQIVETPAGLGGIQSAICHLPDGQDEAFLHFSLFLFSPHPFWKEKKDIVLSFLGLYLLHFQFSIPFPYHHIAFD